MIKIMFTCFACNNVEEITLSGIDGRNAVPVCDECYGKFQKRKGRILKSIDKLHKEFNISVDTFNVEELI